MEATDYADGSDSFDDAGECEAGSRIDQASTALVGAVDALRMVPPPMPSELSACFGALGDLLRQVDQTLATMTTIYARYPVERLRDVRGSDLAITVELVTEAFGDQRRHANEADSALQRGHNSAARLASLD